MKKIFIIFLISLVIQLALIFILKVPITSDAGFYDNLATNLAAGRGFSVDGVNPAAAGGIKQGYILFLALIYRIFGHSILVVKIVQSIFISLSCIITYKIGMDLFNERIGYYSALVTALHPAFIIISSHIITESMFTFLFAVSILYLVLAMKKRSLKLYLLSGIFLGVSTQVRFTPIFFPFFIFAGLFLFYKKKLYALKASATILLAVIIIAVPWTIRNYLLSNYAILPLEEYSGALWFGSYVKGAAHNDNPETQRALTEIIRSTQEYCLENEIPADKVPIELQKVLLKRSFENIKEDPLRYIGLFPKKIARLWLGSYSGFFMIDIPFSDFMHIRGLIKRHPFILFWKLFVLSFSLVVFCLGVIGMILGFKKWKKILPLYLVISYFTLVHMVLFANTRMGIPALPFMIIFASFALFKILEKRKISC